MKSGQLVTKCRVAASAAISGLYLVSGLAIAAGNSLVDVTHMTLPGSKQQLAFTLSGPAEEPRAFTIENPARIALDLLDTSNELDDRIMEIGSGLLQNVTTVEAGGRTRVVINLASMMPYSTTIAGNQLLLTLDPENNGFNATPADVAAATTSIMADPSAPAAIGSVAANSSIVTADQINGGNSVRQIDFRRGPMGEGRVVFTLSGAGVPSDMREEGGRVIIDFPSTEMPRDLQKRLDVTDFGTPISHVDALSTNQGSRVIIQPATQFFEQMAYQSDNTFTVELKPLTREEAEDARKAKEGYNGDKLSLNFQDIEIRSVLQLLADFTDLNIVVSDSVQGKLTLRLKNVPWDQALDIILQAKALDKRQAGNVIMIAPAEEIANRERIELEGMKQKTELAPLRTEFFQANYAKAAELSELLKSGTGSILSERGSVSVDERTNTLLINDTADQLAEIRALVHRLDVPIRQVLIESRIVIASDDFNKDLGVRWGLNRNTIGADGEGFVTSGNQLGIDNLIDQEAIGQERFNINLPANNPAGSLSLALAKLPFGTLLELELSAMQAEGTGEVISSPRPVS